jgi:Zn-dependent alcohol dehydrogenase
MSGRAPVWDPTLDQLATTMKAAIFTGPNAPLRLDTVPRPEPSAGEVLVKVTACGLCHTDLHYMDHGVPTFKTPPLVLGHEISGTIVRVGTGVDQTRVGSSVLLAPVTSCGVCAMCRTGRENVCADQKMLGNTIDGGFAEYVVAPRAHLAHGDLLRQQSEHTYLRFREVFFVVPTAPLADAELAFASVDQRGHQFQRLFERRRTCPANQRLPVAPDSVGAKVPLAGNVGVGVTVYIIVCLGQLRR